MKILVTGAESSLALNFIPVLIKEGHEIIVSDKSDTIWNVKIPLDNNNYHKPFYLTDLEHVISDDVTFKIRKRKVDCVIHCAEDTIPCLEPHIYYTNTYYLTTVLKACAETGTRCIVPTWKEFHLTNLNDSLWKSSIKCKNQLVKFYNIGNAVNNLIYIPRIILNNMHPNVYGNIIGRFYNSICSGYKFIIDNDEFNRNEYIGTEHIIKCILQNISRKTRNNFIIDGYVVNDIDLISYFLYIFDIHFIDIYSKNNEPIIVKRPNNEPSDELIHADLKKIILEQFNKY